MPLFFRRLAELDPRDGRVNWISEDIGDMRRSPSLVHPGPQGSVSGDDSVSYWVTTKNEREAVQVAPADGAVLRRVSGTSVLTTLPVIGPGGIAYFGGGTNTLGVNATGDGVIVFTDARWHIEGACAVSHTGVLVCVSNSEVTAFDVSDVASPTVLWRNALGLGLMSGAVTIAANGTAAIVNGALSPYIHSFNLTDGGVLWQTRIRDEMNAVPTVTTISRSHVRGKLYAVYFDTLFALDEWTGAVLFSTVLRDTSVDVAEFQIAGPTMLDDELGVVYVPEISRHTYFAVDADSGAVLAEMLHVEGSVTISGIPGRAADGALYVYTADESADANLFPTRNSALHRIVPYAIVHLAERALLVDEDDGTVAIEVLRSGHDANTTFTVDVILTGGTATSGADFQATTTITLTFGVGCTSRVASVAIVADDDITEVATETFTASLGNLIITSAWGWAGPPHIADAPFNTTEVSIVNAVDERGAPWPSENADAERTSRSKSVPRGLTVGLVRRFSQQQHYYNGFGIGCSTMGVPCGAVCNGTVCPFTGTNRRLDSVAPTCADAVGDAVAGVSPMPSFGAATGAPPPGLASLGSAEADPRGYVACAWRDGAVCRFPPWHTGFALEFPGGVSLGAGAAVYAAGNEDAMRLDPRDGSAIWTFPLVKLMRRSFAIDDLRGVLVGARDESLLVFNSSTGAVVGNFSLNFVGSEWTGSSPNLGASGFTHVSNRLGTVRSYILDTETGDLLWTAPEIAESSRASVGRGGVLFRSSGDQTVFTASNFTTGQSLWNATLSAGSHRPQLPVPSRGVTAILAIDGILYVLNASSGATVASVNVPCSTSNTGCIVAHPSGHELYVSCGTTVSAVSTENFNVTFSSAISDVARLMAFSRRHNLLWVLTDDGSVFALDPRNGEHVHHFSLGMVGLSSGVAVAPDGSIFAAASKYIPNPVATDLAMTGVHHIVPYALVHFNTTAVRDGVTVREDVLRFTVDIVRSGLDTLTPFSVGVRLVGGTACVPRDVFLSGQLCSMAAPAGFQCQCAATAGGGPLPGARPPATSTSTPNQPPSSCSSNGTTCSARMAPLKNGSIVPMPVGGCHAALATMHVRFDPGVTVMPLELTVAADLDFAEGNETVTIELVDVSDLRTAPEVEARPWTEVQLAEAPFRSVQVTITEPGSPYAPFGNLRVNSQGHGSYATKGSFHRYAPWTVESE
jgi:hypothetical protein